MNFYAAGSRNFLRFLRQGQMEDAIRILSSNFISPDTADIEAAFHRSIPAFSADVILFLFVVALFLVFSRNRQAIAVQINRNIFFFEAGQISGQFISVSIIHNIGSAEVGIKVAAETIKQDCG